MSAGSDITAQVHGRGQGFAVSFRIGDLERILETSRGKVRLFASLDTVGGFVRALGISQFDVDMTSYEPGRLRAPRPDRAEALRSTRTKLKQQLLGFQNVELR